MSDSILRKIAKDLEELDSLIKVASCAESAQRVKNMFGDIKTKLQGLGIRGDHTDFSGLHSNWEYVENYGRFQADFTPVEFIEDYMDSIEEELNKIDKLSNGDQQKDACKAMRKTLDHFKHQLELVFKISKEQYANLDSEEENDNLPVNHIRKINEIHNNLDRQAWNSLMKTIPHVEEACVHLVGVCK